MNPFVLGLCMDIMLAKLYANEVPSGVYVREAKQAMNITSETKSSDILNGSAVIDPMTISILGFNILFRHNGQGHG
jgi:hypothetical protein